MTPSLRRGNDPLGEVTPSIVGTNASDFRVTGNTCLGGTFAPGASCRLDVVFGPTAPGTRAAEVLIASNAPGAAVRVALSGVADGTPPVSSFDTVNGAVLLPGQLVQGTISDDIAGIATATVTFTSAASSGRFDLVLGCSPAREFCRWSRAVPLVPGIYTVIVVGMDLAGNVENPGRSISVIVL